MTAQRQLHALVRPLPHDASSYAAVLLDSWESTRKSSDCAAAAAAVVVGKAPRASLIASEASIHTLCVRLNREHAEVESVHVPCVASKKCVWGVA